jgi:hypothetical protein
MPPHIEASHEDGIVWDNYFSWETFCGVSHSLMRAAYSSSPSIGDAEEGTKWRRQLRAGKTCREQLVALGRILYLVRSNLVHRSKAEAGDDKEIVVNSVHALKVLLEQTIALTKDAERVS